jgi:hypothetical protein
MMSAPSRTSHPWFLLGVLATCMCGLMLQIMETRIISVIAYYHLAFFAIGIGMLGMTAGALTVFYRFDRTYTPQRLFQIMSGVMAVFAWSTLASLVGVLVLAIDAQYEPTLSFVIGWGVLLLVLLPPYVLLGIAVSLALTRSSQRVSLVYGVDLLGAAAGCLVTLALLTVTDTYTAILIVGACGAGAGLAFRKAVRSAGGAAAAQPTGPAVRGMFLNPGIAAVALLVAAAGNHLLGPYGLRPLVVKNTVLPAYQLAEERWNSFSRIAMSMRPHSDAFLWSASALAPHKQLDQGWLSIDGEAGTPIYHYTGDPRELDFLQYDVTSLAYSIRHQGRSAVIGIGGGRDLLTASISGFHDITGVEYNPIFVQLFSKDYRSFSGAEHIAGLRLVVDDARSWFSRSREQFDLIQMSLIDTWAATGAGAFTLSENGLYTVNGWKRFLSRLTPGGVFTVSRWYAPDRPDETARILSLAMATLIEMGEAHPQDHIYLAGNGKLSTLIVGRAPLTPSDIRTLDDTVSRLQYRGLVAPGRTAADPIFERILQAKTVAELVEIGKGTVLNLTPTWDSNPFFFNQLRLSDPNSMVHAAHSSPGVIRGNLLASLTLITLVVVSMLAVCAVLLGPARSAAYQAATRSLFWSSAYFMTIGLAFMFVEISLIQRMSLLLGHPIYGLAIVLFSIILATGIGSLISERVMPLSPLAVTLWPVALAVYLGTLPMWFGSVVDSAGSGSLLERAATCLVIVVPAGILMGFMFPAGMRLCSRLDNRMTPWLWAVNGAAGVLASSLAVLVSIETSLNHALWVGAIGYALLSIIALRLLKLTLTAATQDVGELLAPGPSSMPA